TSCEYDASDAAGCGTTFTLIPVSFVKRVASASSRLCELPTESPMNLIFWPPYFALSALAFGTFGALTAAAAVRLPTCLRAPPAVATLSETTRANAPASPANTSTPRCLTVSPPFRTANRCGQGVGRSEVPPRGRCFTTLGLSCQRAQTTGGGQELAPSRAGLAVG